MKRMLLIWLSAVMIGALILSGCGPTPAPAPTEVPPTPTPKPAAPTPVPAAEELTLGLSLSTLDNPFFVTLKEGAEEAAGKAGVKLIVVDCEDDSAKEAANLEDLIAKEVDALLINPTDAEAVVPSIGKANAAGIPVFTIDRAAAGGEIVSHIASDNVSGGRMAGEKLAALLDGKGKVVELEGITGTSSARERGQGFNEVMDGYADIEVVARQTADYDRAKGLSVFENILEAQPEINGVFAHNDEMILGAIEAAEAAGRAGEIVFVGFDAIDDAVAAVEEGKLAATIAQQPSEMGRLGVEFAAKHLGGETVEEYIPVDLALVEAEAKPMVAEEFTLGLSLSTLDNPFFVTLKEGAEEAAAKAGVKLIVVDCEDDSAKEAANLEDLIAKEVDALLINPTDAEAVVPSIGKANEAGIPVFTIDRAAAGGEIVSHIASDNVSGGKMAGEKLAELLGNKGKVVELEGITGTSSARERGQGFNEVMDGYADIEVVARQTADYDRAKGLSVFENILEAQPEINGVFAHNDEMILGAIEAAEAAGRAGEMVFVGFDAIDDAVAAVEEGKLAATIAQQPSEMGRLGVEFAAKHLGGETVEEYIPVDLALVEAETKPMVAEEFTLGLSLSTLDNPFFVTLKEGAEEAAGKAGVKLIVVDCEDDSAKEAANLEDLIAKEVDALLINPTDAEAVVPSIGKANEAGIPVFTIDRAAAGGEIVSHIASDNVSGGKMAGQKLAELLGNKGKVVELEGITGTSSARERGQGFNEVMDGYPDIEVVARQTADYDRAKGLSVFENILEAQPEINGVFAHNDEMILGAIEAAEAAGRLEEMVFVGFDAIDDAVAAVEEGKLAATIAQQPSEMGRLGVEFAVKHLSGETVEAYIPVDLALVTP